jgi:hypothetical protein
MYYEKTGHLGHARIGRRVAPGGDSLKHRSSGERMSCRRKARRLPALPSVIAVVLMIFGRG